MAAVVAAVAVAGCTNGDGIIAADIYIYIPEEAEEVRMWGLAAVAVVLVDISRCCCCHCCCWYQPLHSRKPPACRHSYLHSQLHTYVPNCVPTFIVLYVYIYIYL